jgi:hypothetical protein
MVVIEPFSKRVRQAVEGLAPSAHTVADLIGETWLTMAR